ncbi:hypothetical protein ACU4HD_28825 [Cupriavidus basilensis]
MHANGDLALNGNVSNAGTVESLGNIAVTGGDYDNRGGTTQANGDLKFDIGGTLNNIGSVLGANGNLHIAAGAVINDRTAPWMRAVSPPRLSTTACSNPASLAVIRPGCKGEAVTIAPPMYRAHRSTSRWPTSRAIRMAPCCWSWAKRSFPRTATSNL